MMTDVVVIGGGVSGLSCAAALIAQGHDVRLLEGRAITGGNAVSQKFDGYLMEHGPSALNSSVADALNRLDGLGLAESAMDLGPMVKNRFLRDSDKISGISTHPLGFLLSDYLSLSARISMVMEVFRRPLKDATDESIFEFTSRRFGQGFAERIMEPLAAGLFMGDSRQLSVRAAFPKLVGLETEFGSILRGVINAKRGSEPGRRMLSWEGGIATIPDTIAKGIDEHISTGVRVNSIRKTSGGFAVSTESSGDINCRAVVLAVQPHVAAQLLDGVESETSKALGQISAPSIGVVFLGYQRDQVSHPLDGLGFLSTKTDGQVISGTQFSSSMYQGRAPDGHVAITCYTGGSRRPDLAALPDRELINLVHKELSGLLGIKGMPVISRTHRWAHGIPHYNIGHAKRCAVIESANERCDGLFLTGNYFDGVSVANCMAKAERVAAKASRHLATSDEFGRQASA